jgi:hypothetical protein
MDLNMQEQKDLKVFLANIFGAQVNRWPMNGKMFNLTYEMLAESSKCSSAMDFVPRPMPIGASPIKWLTKQAKDVFLRQLRSNKDHYTICVKATSLKMKTKFHMVASGL